MVNANNKMISDHHHLTSGYFLYVLRYVCACSSQYYFKLRNEILSGKSESNSVAHFFNILLAFCISSHFTLPPLFSK